MIITAGAKALYKRTQHYTLNVRSRGKQLVFLYRLRLHVCVVVFIHEKENWECFSLLLSRHFLPCFDVHRNVSRAGYNCSDVSRSGFILFYSRPCDQESTNGSPCLVE